MSIFLFIFNACDGNLSRIEITEPASLQALVYLDSQTIAVTDTAYSRGRWGEGRLIVVDLNSKQRLGAWFTPFANPQALSLTGKYLTVLSSGTLQLGTDPKGGWSSLSLLDKDARRMFKPTYELWLHQQPKGAYLLDIEHLESTIFSSSWVMSSGIDGLLWRADIDEEDAHVFTHRFAPLEDLTLGSIAMWKDKVILVDFNQDRLHIFDSSGIHYPCSPEIGQYETVMEGAQTPLIIDNRLWVSFGLSGRLIHLDLDELNLEDESCFINPVVYSPPLGQVPNDLKVHDQKVFVLHSAESAVWTYDEQTGQRIERRGLPMQTNPWQMALSPDGQQLAISEWLSGGLTLLNLDNEAELTQLSPSLFTPPALPMCIEPIGFDRLSKDGLEIGPNGIELEWSEIKDTAEASHFDLNGVPQIALLFSSPPQSLEFQVKLDRGSDWIILKPQPSIFSVKPSHTPRPDIEKQEWDSVDSTLMSTPVEAQLQRLNTDNEENSFDHNPCSLFLPRSPALRLNLVDLLSSHIFEESRSLPILQSGKVKLFALHIKVGENERAIRLKSAAYRRWK